MRDFDEFVGIVTSDGFRSEVDRMTSELHERFADVDDAAFATMRSDMVNLFALRRYHEWLHQQG